MTADSKTNYDTETKNSEIEKKIRNCRKRNFEDEANDMQFDKEDTESVTLALKCPNSYCFVCSKLKL